MLCSLLIVNLYKSFSVFLLIYLQTFDIHVCRSIVRQFTQYLINRFNLILYPAKMVRRKQAPRSNSSIRSSVSSKSKSTSEAASTRTKTLVHRRLRPGQRALKEIKYFQKSTKLLIPKSPFIRLVREIILDLFPRLDNYRIQAKALEALQEAAEMYLVQFFEDAILLSLHAKRVTLFPQDMRLVRRMRGRSDIVNR